MLESRLALVTGASRGIGYAVCAALRDAGVDVIMVARGEDRLRKAADRIGGRAIPADVSDPESVQRLAEAVNAGGRPVPDILISAAGAFALAPVAETDPADFGRQLAVNLRGPFLLMRAFLSDMIERGSGHIVTLGSVAGRRAFPHNGAYSASKFGVRGLHAVLDEELKGTGVRATLVEPAATDTPLWDDVDYTRHPGLPPREAMLRPEAVAEGVLFALTRPPDVDVRVIALDRT